MNTVLHKYFDNVYKKNDSLNWPHSWGVLNHPMSPVGPQYAVLT